MYYDSYDTDMRVRGGRREKLEVNETKMTAKVTLYFDREVVVNLPVKYAVCDVCEGTGRHVNPSIDCNGLTRADFDEDPGFFEDYTNGTYDVTCYTCGGKRIIPVFEESRFNAAQKNAFRKYQQYLREEVEYERECMMERRMGA